MNDDRDFIVADGCGEEDDVDGIDDKLELQVGSKVRVYNREKGRKGSFQTGYIKNVSDDGTTFDIVIDEEQGIWERGVKKCLIELIKQGRTKKYTFLSSTARNSIGRRIRKKLQFVYSEALLAVQFQNLNEIDRDVITSLATGELTLDNVKKLDEERFCKAKDLVDLVEIWGNPKLNKFQQPCKSSKMLLHDLIKETEVRKQDTQISSKHLQELAENFLTNKGSFTKPPREKKEPAIKKAEKDEGKKKKKASESGIKKEIDGELEKKGGNSSSDNSNKKNKDNEDAEMSDEDNEKMKTLKGNNFKKNVCLTSLFLSPSSDVVDALSAEEKSHRPPVVDDSLAQPAIKSSDTFAEVLHQIIYQFPEEFPTKLRVDLRTNSSSDLVVLLGRMNQVQHLWLQKVISPNDYQAEFVRLVMDLVQLELILVNRKLVEAQSAVTSYFSIFYCLYMMLIRADTFKNTNVLVSPLNIVKGNDYSLQGEEGAKTLIELISADRSFYEELKERHDSNTIEFNNKYDSKFSIDDVTIIIQLLEEAEHLLQKNGSIVGNDSSTELQNTAENWKEFASKCMVFCQKNTFPLLFFNHEKDAKNDYFIMEGISHNDSRQKHNGGSRSTRCYYTYDKITQALQEPVDNGYCIPIDTNRFEQIQLCGNIIEMEHFNHAFKFVCGQIHLLLLRVDISSPTQFTTSSTLLSEVDLLPTFTTHCSSNNNNISTNDDDDPHYNIISCRKRSNLMKVKEYCAKINTFTLSKSSPETCSDVECAEMLLLSEEVNKIIEELLNTNDN